MKVADILKACSSGTMPSVKTKKPVKGAKSDVGRVVVIKQNTTVSNYAGIAVQFPGLTYDTWFSEAGGTDQRTKYMDDLEFPG